MGCHLLLQGIFGPRDQTCVSCIGRQILYYYATWEVLYGSVRRRLNHFTFQTGLSYTWIHFYLMRTHASCGFHAPSDDISRLWAGKKKRKEVTVNGEDTKHLPGGEIQARQEGKSRHARNAASGKLSKDPSHPCCSEETAPLFTEAPSFVGINSSHTYS